MNRPDDHDDDCDDPVLDWALGERIGGVRPPDLTAAVRARLLARPVPHRGNRWLAAALVMLGVAAVCGVALWPKDRAASETPVPVSPVLVQEPKPAFVGSVADAAALPADTRVVEASGVGDDVIEALVRLRDLEVLTVREPCNEAFGLSLKMMPPKNSRHITYGCWQRFAKFTKLRRLELIGTPLVARCGVDDGASEVAAIQRLPLLESVALSFLDAGDAVIARLAALPNLRTLDLSFNHGFAEDGMKALLQCRSLQKLSLRGCQQLQGTWIGALGSLPELEDLDVSLIDGLNWRAGTDEPRDAFSDNVRQVARGWADSLQAGVSDAALAGLAKSAKLRVLDIASGRWSHAGLVALGASATLRELDMFGDHNAESTFVAGLPKGLLRLEVCGDYGDDFCTAVRENLTSLRHLCIAACYQITDRGIEAVCEMPSLRILDMRQMRGLTAASAATVGKALQLEELDLRHDDWLTVAHVRTIKRALPNLRTVQTNFSAEQLAAAERLPSEQRVMSKGAIDALPRDSRNVVAVNIVDADVAALLRLQDIERLRIESMRGTNAKASITAKALQQLAGLPALRVLEIDGQAELDLDLGEIDGLRHLETLQLGQMGVGDDAFGALSRMPHLRALHLLDCRGFGAAGLRRLADCAMLREVSLHGCKGVEADWLLPWVGRRDLEWLDLSMVGKGISGPVWQAIGEATSLRYLDVSHAGFDAGDLRHLQGLPKLQTVKLDGTAVTGKDLRWLPPGITTLSLRECEKLGAQFGADLGAAMPRLQTLDLGGAKVGDAAVSSLGACGRLQKLILAENAGLEDACLQALAGMTSLRDLDLSYCSGFSARSIEGITGLTQLEHLTLRGWDQFAAADWDRIRRMPNLISIQNARFFEKLR